jgi:hypothetical protein
MKENEGVGCCGEEKERRALTDTALVITVMRTAPECAINAGSRVA